MAIDNGTRASQLINLRSTFIFLLLSSEALFFYTFAKMASLLLHSKLCFYSAPSGLSFNSRRGRRHDFSVQLPRKTELMKVRSASEQSRQQPQQSSEERHTKRKTRGSISGAEKGTDPVGFLTKLGISHKAFAQFLRERYSIVLAC